MNIWEMLDAIGERRAAMKVARMAAAPAGPRFLTPQFLIALILIGLFGWAFATAGDKDTKNLMVGALIAAFAGAWGYFLGSSNGASRSADRTDTALTLAHDTVKLLPAPPTPPTTTLQPGETAQAAPAVPEGEER